MARLWDPGAHDVVHLRSGENSVWSFEGSVFESSAFESSVFEGSAFEGSAFERKGRHILRVTSEAHRARDQLKGELAFVEHLIANGVNAARPVEPLAGEKVVDVSRIVGSQGATYATVFERFEGRHFQDYSNDMGRPLFNEWGRTMGRLHLLSETFSAPPGLRRPDWDQDEVAGCSVIDVDIDDRLLELRNELVGWLSGTTREPTRYGMVHGDLERTNFVLNDGAIGIFDFDDCCHHWFCWDMVCALWRFRNAAQDDRAAFLGWFLEGYGAVREPDAAMLKRFSDLIRLRSVGLLLYRARAQEASPTDDWAQRTRSWLDSTWSW
jgi:Ser/Thr protein kinase RdoA (MazF antagonist)